MGNDVRHAGDQTLGVGVAGMADDVLHGALLGFAPRIHDDHPVGHFGDRAHVMGDHDDRRAGLGAQIAQQVENLRLYGHIKRGGWFVRDQELGLAGQRDGDHDPLALTAGHLERVVLDPCCADWECAPRPAARSPSPKRSAPQPLMARAALRRFVRPRYRPG